jgi:hypothetical protein
MSGETAAQIAVRRLAACDACPKYVPAPPSLLSALAGMVLPDTRICSHCGCFMAKKARIASSRCPELDPDNPALSRWREPHN